MHVNVRRQYWRTIEGKSHTLMIPLDVTVSLSKCLLFKGARLYYFHSLIVVRLHTQCSFHYDL